MALTTGLFVFSKIGAQEQHVVLYDIAHKRSQFRAIRFQDWQTGRDPGISGSRD